MAASQRPAPIPYLRLSVYAMGMAPRRKPRPNTAYVYVRVSTGRQAANGDSLDGQERATIEAARSMGYDDVIVVREEGRSAGTISRRPQLVQTLDALRRGDGAALIVSKVDRLSRDGLDVHTVAKAADRQGWRLVSLDIGLDTGTPTGALVLAVLAGVAEFERERMRERMRNWHDERAAKGRTWGVDDGPRPVLSDEVRRRIRDERAGGRSLAGIADGLNLDKVPTAKGGARWYPSTVRAVLSSPAMAALAG